ncbi:HNH endonuclease [Leucothrix arctica]|uniref:HNH endonuclease n=1 Tax=Leucothrix arctica TaxID=1481894 RepID=A0A317CQR8_9GAMM|nr:HNH endonuclease signature motif containing protein [Leucothrix arctica]PWQ98750.1 HNH endonuclease [Leucothrix arctica]
MIQAKFYETYYFCNIIRNILHDQFSYLVNLNEFYGDGAYINLVGPFDRYSSLHQFIEFIVDDVFYENASSVDLDKRKNNLERLSSLPTALRGDEYRQLPIELALEFHNIKHESFEAYLVGKSKDFLSCDEDDIYDYMAELRFTGEYEALIDQTVKEVFHVLYQNRELMLLFNDMVSRNIEYQVEDGIPDSVSKLFKKNGTLLRKTIPKWVQRAVFFRDRGRCVLCDKDLSGLINLENYDHIVPLARHGLNDISNIQLLCRECNNKKRAGSPTTSNTYQSWYAYD